MSSKKHRAHSSFAHVCENSERYVLILSFETNDGEEHLLNSLRQEIADDTSQVQDDFAVQIRVPLERYHIATVNPAWCQKHRGQSATPDWLPLAHLHTSSLSNDRGPSDKENASLETCDVTEAIEMTISEQDNEFAELIHALADKLPATGHYLDVIWLATDTTDALINDHISLYGALQRLCSWHGAHLTVVLQDSNSIGPDYDMYDGCLSAWVNHLHGRLVGDEQSVMEVLGQDTAWRGEVVLADGKGQKSLSLPGFVLRPHRNDSPQILLKKTDAASVCASPGMKTSKSQAARKIVTFSRQLEVVCTVCRASVPSAFLSPVTLSLQHLSGVRLPRSKHFLSWLSEVGQTNDAAVIMRLRCRTLVLGTHSTRSLSTKAWKDHIKNNSAASDLTVPDLHLRETQEFFYLLVHRNPGPSQEVIAQVMYSPQEMTGEVHAQLSEYQQSLTFDECQNVDTALNTVACLDGSQVQRLLETITLAQAEAIKTFIEERRQEGREPAITLAELQLLMGTVYSSVMAEIDEMSQMADVNDGVHVHTEDDLGSRNIVSESDLSPSSWMQRLALQNHEALERKIKRFKSGDMMLAGMPVPAPADNTITLTADEFLKHFQASGLPTTEDLSPVSTATADRPGGGTLRNICPSLAWSDLKKATFQEAQKYTFPGIQYCLDSGRSQQIDRHFSKMQQRYIRYETASTCSSEQAASPATLTLPQAASATDPTPATRKARGQGRKDGQGSWGHRSDERGQQQRPAVRAQRSVERAQRVLKGQRSAEKRRRISLERGHKFSPGKRLASGTKRKVDEAPVTLPQKRLALPTRTSPRKRVMVEEKPDRKPLAAKTSEDDQKAATSMSSSKPRKLSNSEKTRMKLRQVVKETILSRGITKENACYKACTERLYRMAELYVKDLKSSRGLNEEMRNIAEANADFVVQFEQNRIKNS